MNPLETELLTGQSVHFVRSAVLNGEVICLAADDVDLPLDECGRYKGCCVYRVSELEALCWEKPDAAALQARHEEKKRRAVGRLEL